MKSLIFDFIYFLFRNCFHYLNRSYGRFVLVTNKVPSSVTVQLKWTPRLLRAKELPAVQSSPSESLVNGGIYYFEFVPQTGNGAKITRLTIIELTFPVHNAVIIHVVMSVLVYKSISCCEIQGPPKN